MEGNKDENFGEEEELDNMDKKDNDDVNQDEKVTSTSADLIRPSSLLLIGLSLFSTASST